MKKKSTVLSLVFMTACVAAQDVTLQGLTSGNFRFKDVAGQAFRQNFIDTYSYSTANVTFSFDVTNNDYLSGNVTATGLKPNFAYQIKLSGNPSLEAHTDAEKAAADDATNERLGRIGRWWRAMPNAGNSNDADYDQFHTTAGYVYEGYLNIAFFVTDSAGNASFHFEGRNSFHVLWRVDQRPASSGDGPPLPVTLPDTTGNPAYDVGIAARSLTLYGEHEPTRAPPGTLLMPEAHYRCRLFLTEESFHDTGFLGGQWTTAMAAPFEFNIPTSTPDTPINTPPGVTPPSVLPLDVTRLRANLNFKNPNHDRAWINGTFAVPAGFTSANLEVRAKIFGAVQTYSLNEKGRDVVSGGNFELVAPQSGGTTAAFRLRMSGANFGLTASALQTPPFNVITLHVGADDYSGSVTPETHLRGQKAELVFEK